MKSAFSDTNKLVDEEYTKLLQECPISKKINQIFEMSAWTLNLSKRAIARANPGWSKEEVDLYFVKLFYGDSLHKNLSNYINNKKLLCREK